MTTELAELKGDDGAEQVTGVVAEQCRRLKQHGMRQGGLMCAFPIDSGCEN